LEQSLVISVVVNFFLPRHWIGCAFILVSMIFQQIIDLYINKKSKSTNLKSESVTEESNDNNQLEAVCLPTSLEN